MNALITRLQNRYRWTLASRFGCRMVEVRPKSPVVSFTFDDFPRSALKEGGKILLKHGARGTYYVSMGLKGRELPAGPAFEAEDLRQALADGHELGCHTFDHCHSWQTGSRQFEQSILANQRALAEAVPGARFESLSYPLSWPRPNTKRRAGRHFRCCRGGGPSFNRGATDANHLQACFLEKHRDQPERIKQLIDDTVRECGWLIFATHDVSENPTPFGCSPGFFDDIVQYAGRSARILPIAMAWEAALL